MKKSLKILVAICLVVSCCFMFCVHGFAAEYNFSLDHASNVNGDITFKIRSADRSETFYIYDGSTTDLPINFNVILYNYTYCLSAVLQPSATRSVAAYVDGTYVSLSDNSSSPTVLDTSSSITFSVLDTGPTFVYVRFITSPPPPDPLGPGGWNVSNGLTSAFGFLGDVLDDVVMIPAILGCVGLSVALFAILPWGIKKLKSLIKGY